MAHAVHTLKKLYEYDPIDEAGPTLHRMVMNASENFHIQLQKCIFKVIKPPIIQGPSLQPLEVTHDIQLCHACICKNLHP